MICSPTREEFLTHPVKQVWRGNSIYSALRDAAVEAYPNDFDAAFRQLCDWAKLFVQDRKFKTWASDFRRAEEREILTALAALDVDSYLAAAPPPHTPVMNPEPMDRELEPA